MLRKQTLSLLPECIGQVERTQGTDTSQYLEERKSTETPSVAASERGSALEPLGVKTNVLERTTTEGDSPVVIDKQRRLSRSGLVKP